MPFFCDFTEQVLKFRDIPQGSDQNILYWHIFHVAKINAFKITARFLHSATYFNNIQFKYNFSSYRKLSLKYPAPTKRAMHYQISYDLPTAFHISCDTDLRCWAAWKILISKTSCQFLVENQFSVFHLTSHLLNALLWVREQVFKYFSLGLQIDERSRKLRFFLILSFPLRLSFFLNFFITVT